MVAGQHELTNVHRDKWFSELFNGKEVMYSGPNIIFFFVFTILIIISDKSP